MFKENVKRLLNERGMKVGTLASTIGVSYSTMDSIINGSVDELRIGVDKALAVADYFGVSVEELYDRPAAEVAVMEPTSESSADNNLSHDELELLRLWRKAAPDGRAAAKAVLIAYEAIPQKESAI